MRSSGGSLEVVKWYTRARRFPQLLGRTPDGGRLPGGPYTFTQAIVGGLVLFVGLNSMGLWARYGLIGNMVILLGVAYGAVFAIGRLPIGSRNPLALASGALGALTAPSTGRVDGRRVRLSRPQRVEHTVSVLLTPVPQSWAHAPVNDAPAAPARPIPGAAPAAAPAGRQVHAQLTGVQALLARAAGMDDERGE